MSKGEVCPFLMQILIVILPILRFRNKLRSFPFMEVCNAGSGFLLLLERVLIEHALIERVQKALIFAENKKIHRRQNGKMEVTIQPKITICEMHFHGHAVRTASLSLL
jgi:hypothetical protein